MNEQDRARYLRQVIFQPLGAAGQEKLLAARVLLVGCGATGSVIANLLARAGVGHLTLVDRDFLELNNLQRQVLYDEDDLAAGLPKAVAAASHLRRINSSIRITPIVADASPDNIEEWVQAADLVMDGTDNFETRYLVNDACVKHDKPWVYSGVVGSYGATLTILPHRTACFRCVFPKSPPPGTLPTCDTTGVLGPAVSVVGSLAAAEALKLLTAAGPARADLTHLDVWENTFESFAVHRRDDCPACGLGHYEFLDDAAGDSTAQLCGRNSIQVRAGRGHRLDLRELAERLTPVGAVSVNDYLLKLTVEPYELTIFPDARAIIQGTEDEAVAKSLYSKYIGM